MGTVTPRNSDSVVNVLTVDVEDWFHVQALSAVYSVSDWDNQRTRILGNIVKVLELLDEYQARATFFVLGWIAEKLPEIVVMIDERGHEIGSHSQYHRLVYALDREEFKKDLQKSILSIEHCADVTVRGYRAPSFSIRPEDSWVWEVFSECGIEYDSSVFPVRHDIYGTPSAQRFPYRVEPSDTVSILEIPPTTIRILGANIPVAGGGYLRMFPYWFIRQSIRAINRNGHPAVIYFHPWELDLHQQRIRTNLRSRFRHYTNLRVFEMKLRRLLDDFRFSTISEVFMHTKNNAIV